MADSLAQFFLDNFRAHSRAIAYKQRQGYRTESFTYQDVLTLAAGVASQLRKTNIAKGDRVMLWGENSAQWVAAFWGCVLSGAVVVPMDNAASAEFAARVFAQVGAKMLVAPRARIDQLAAAHISGLAIDDLQQIPQDSPDLPNVPVERADILQIVFTSGATADPKGVIITHENVLSNIAPLEREMRRYLRYEKFVHPLRFLNLLPLSHVFGQFLGMFLPPLLGGTVMFQDDFKPGEIVETIRRERVSVLVSVPRVLQSLKQKVERDLENAAATSDFKRRFTSSASQHFLRRWWTFRAIRRQFGWKFWAMISGGAALDSETEEFWGRLGYAVIQGYGLTETTSLISVNHPFKLGKGSIGKVLPGREVKLADDGEILVRGGGVSSGYWNASGAQRVSDDQGWYRTGDIGALDDAGNLYFKGRKKEVIVAPSGLNIYPDDLEAALRQQPEVKDCIVVAIERAGNAEPCAVVILRGAASIEAAIQRANETLADYQRMRLWIEWPDADFPRTNTQKPRRNVIAEAARERLTHSPEAAGHADRSPISDLIEKVTGKRAPALRGDANLDSDLGLSSLERVELLSAIEDRYQVDLSETRFSSVCTLADLQGMLRGETTTAPPYHYPSWALRWPVTWLRVSAHYLLMRPAIMLLGWPRIIGRENLREFRGPLLVISNHLGDVDAGFILTALPARFRHRLAIATGGEALEALRQPSTGRNFFQRIYDCTQWGCAVALLNLFPLPRAAGFRRSFSYAGQAVDRGYSILVFPEGRHTTDGKVNPFRAGIGLLAQNLGIPVLPMRIDGLFELKRAGKKFAPPWKVQVRIGKPMKFPGMNPEEIARRLQSAVEAL